MKTVILTSSKTNNNINNFEYPSITFIDILDFSL